MLLLFFSVLLAMKLISDKLKFTTIRLVEDWN